jgi:hypothetical protein
MLAVHVSTSSTRTVFVLDKLSMNKQGHHTALAVRNRGVRLTVRTASAATPHIAPANRNAPV